MFSHGECIFYCVAPAAAAAAAEAAGAQQLNPKEGQGCVAKQIKWNQQTVKQF
jgi:hypothetical protein